MSASLRKFTVDANLLKRGFWLYVWSITTGDGQVFHYVGRTGDSSSTNAQSPFARISGHLGSNKNTNQIRKHMLGAGHDLENCASLDLVAFGPIHESTDVRELHFERRDFIAALEKALCDAMTKSGYQVLNKVHSKKSLDAAAWKIVRDSFAERFPKLAEN